jgi:hypothetical protein
LTTVKLRFSMIDGRGEKRRRQCFIRHQCLIGE